MMRLSDLIAVLQTSRNAHGDIALRVLAWDESVCSLDEVSIRIVREPSGEVVAELDMLMASEYRYDDEAPIGAIFGRVEPLPDRDPTAPHEEPPDMPPGYVRHPDGSIDTPYNRLS